jgi:aerobic carbon-monoxide dehydrogenase small subunit
MIDVRLTINDQLVQRTVDPRTLLVEFLRRDLRLTGTHVGCDTTQCGACTVLVDGRATKSCTVLVAQLQGVSVTTIEGACNSGGKLSPLQNCFREHHGLQCGFCTPGMVMVSTDLLRRVPRPTEQQIRHQLEGNLCRCTGYHNIVRAVQAAAEEGAE